MSATNEIGEILGEFWLPEHSSTKFGGLLKVGRRDTSLELLGYFGPEIDIILGSTKELGAVTLVDCCATTLPVPDGHPLPTSDRWGAYTASYLFVGSHLYDGWDTRFIEVEVELPLIDVWAGLNSDSLMDSVTGHERDPRVICRAQATNFECVVFNYVTSSGGIRDYQRDEAYRSVSKFVLTMNEGTPMSELHDRAYQVRNFLSLMLGTPCEIDKVTFNNPYEFDEQGFVISNSAHLNATEDHEIEPDANVLFRQLMPFSEIGDQFENALKKWFLLADSMNMEVWLFFSGSYNLRSYSPYLEQRLVALVHALESFHRRSIGGFREDEIAWQHKVDSVVGSVPVVHREWTRSSLAYSNQKVLQTRLEELFTSISPVVQTLLQKPKRFVRKCVATRNYFSHYDDSRAADRFKRHEHYAAIMILSMLLESLLLRELGFKPKHISKRVEMSQKYIDLRFQRHRYEISF